MLEHPNLSEAEWALVTELLEHEHRELAVEIRHTRSSAFREELQQRRKMVHDLIDRMKLPTTV
jgi:hypothetical protein